MKSICTILFLVSGLSYASLPTRGVDVLVEKNVDFSVENTTNEWLTIAEYSIVDLPQSTLCIYSMCNGAGDRLTLTVPRNNKPYAKSTFTNYAHPDSPMQFNTPDGVMLIRLTFSDTDLRAFLRNNENSRVWVERVSIDNKVSASIQVSPDNPCGAFIGGCPFTTIHGLQTSVLRGKAKVEVKLPPSISSKEYTINNLSLAKIETAFNKTNTNIGANYTTSYFVLSGKIKVPERCYLNIDGHSNGMIIFNDVDASSHSDNNIPLQTKKLLLRSTCTGVVGASMPLVSEVRVSPVGDTQFSNGVFRLKPIGMTGTAKASEKYLGIVAKYLPDTTSCNVGDGYTFVSDSYFNKKTVVPANNMSGSDVSSTSFISLGLCTFGSANDLLVSGDHTGAIQLTTRWRFAETSN